MTSPPYNLGAMSGGYANLTGGYAQYGDNLPHDEYVEWQREVLRECWRVTSDAGAIFYNHKPRVRGGLLWTPLELNPDLPLRQIVTWIRSSGVNWSETHFMPLCEWVMIFAKPEFRMTKATSTWGDAWKIHQLQGHQRPDHPAPFPQAIPIRAITALSDSGETSPILDPFAGSGSTLVAAKFEGRRAIGVEIDERYCEIAARRLAQDTLFGASA